MPWKKQLEAIKTKRPTIWSRVSRKQRRLPIRKRLSAKKKGREIADGDSSYTVLISVFS